MEIEDDPPASIPEWVVTFGDMMSLLLTFFIMLVSMSEIKSEEKYQSLVDAIQKQFGYSESSASLIPGEKKPRNSRLPDIATTGRARKVSTESGGDKVEAPVGDHPHVALVRPGADVGIGASARFEEPGSAELSPEALAALDDLAVKADGKPQLIAVAGHTSFRPLPPGSPFADHWDLAYARALNAAKRLQQGGIRPERIRIVVAGPFDPVRGSVDVLDRSVQDRVEVFLLDAIVAEFSQGASTAPAP